MRSPNAAFSKITRNLVHVGNERFGGRLHQLGLLLRGHMSGEMEVFKLQQTVGKLFLAESTYKKRAMAANISTRNLCRCGESADPNSAVSGTECRESVGYSDR